MTNFYMTTHVTNGPCLGEGNGSMWDKWRSQYPWLTHEQQCDFAGELFDFRPDQQHYDVGAALAIIPDDHLHVIEMGGWRGELAAKVLAQRPSLREWDNWDLCEEAVVNPVCQDGRYWPHLLTIPVWEQYVGSPVCDIFVASHVIEHLTITDFCLLANWLKGIPLIHFQAPLKDHGENWMGSVCSHIMPIGWKLVETIMWENQFIHIGNHNFRYAPEWKADWTELLPDPGPQRHLIANDLEVNDIFEWKSDHADNWFGYYIVTGAGDKMTVRPYADKAQLKGDKSFEWDRPDDLVRVWGNLEIRLHDPRTTT